MVGESHYLQNHTNKLTYLTSYEAIELYFHILQFVPSTSDFLFDFVFFQQRQTPLKDK